MQVASSQSYSPSGHSSVYQSITNNKNNKIFIGDNFLLQLELPTSIPSQLIQATPLPATHCKKITIYVSPEKELRDLSPNFHIHVSVSDLCIPMIIPLIFLQQNMQTDRGNIYIAHRNKYSRQELGLWKGQFFFQEQMFRVFGIVSLQCTQRYKE